jgi:hypothetical protein
MNNTIDIAKIFNAPKVTSGEEYDYHYVLDNGHYTLQSFDKSAMFVLPPKPTMGTTIYFSDQDGSTKYFPVKIHRNGNLIMGESEHMSCDVSNVMFKMKFVGGYVGWRVLEDSRFTKKIKGKNT